MQEDQPGTYAIQFSPRFERSYKRKTPDQRQAVYDKIVLLRSNPKHPSLRVKKIRHTAQIWEASINMSRRLTFEYSDDHTTIIMRNCNGHGILGNP